MDKGKGNGSHSPLFISLVVNDLLLHNCMLHSGAFANVMSLKVMNQLGLKISRPYKSVCAMDSREIKVCGLIEDLQVNLTVFPDISVLMDIVVIDVPDAWGILLSRKWAASLGGSLQRDLSYATIPTCNNTFVTLHKEQEKKYRVEDPQDPLNEPLYEEKELGSFAILLKSLAPLKEESREKRASDIWRMNFDRAHSI